MFDDSVHRDTIQIKNDDIVLGQKIFTQQSGMFNEFDKIDDKNITAKNQYAQSEKNIISSDVETRFVQENDNIKKTIPISIVQDNVQELKTRGTNKFSVKEIKEDEKSQKSVQNSFSENQIIDIVDRYLKNEFLAIGGDQYSIN